MSDKTKTVLLRAARALGAVLVSYALAWIAGPDALAVFGDNTALIAAVLTPVLLAADKWFRYTDDDNNE